MEWLINLYDGVAMWLATLTISKIVNTFWFFFIIEFPRYYLLDLVVLSWRKINGASRRRQEAEARFRLRTENPFVSVIVPGKNEGGHVHKLTRSLQEQTYRNFELVVVDDGSDDFSRLICNDLMKHHFINRFYSVGERGGKASAANLALMNNQAKYIVHLDADSSLDRNAIEEILLPFYLSDRIKAVGGSVKVRNNKESICTSLQAAEYLEAIMVGRTVTSEVKLFRTISGAFGAFDMETLKQIGAWDIGPGLDGDITQKIRKSGWDVYFTPRSVCLTSAPVKFFQLFNQRMRWSKSLIRFRIRKHANVFNIRYKNFRIVNFLSNAENIFFNLVMDQIWLFYMIDLILSNTGSLLELFLLKQLVAFPFSLLSFAMIMGLTERPREEFFLIKYTLLGSIYSGYFLRSIRIIASWREFFFFSSYKDPWNPPKSSAYAQELKF